MKYLPYLRVNAINFRLHTLRVELNMQFMKYFYMKYQIFLISCISALYLTTNDGKVKSVPKVSRKMMSIILSTRKFKLLEFMKVRKAFMVQFPTPSPSNISSHRFSRELCFHAFLVRRYKFLFWYFAPLIVIFNIKYKFLSDKKFVVLQVHQRYSRDIFMISMHCVTHSSDGCRLNCYPVNSREDYMECNKESQNGMKMKFSENIKS